MMNYQIIVDLLAKKLLPKCLVSYQSEFKVPGLINVFLRTPTADWHLRLQLEQFALEVRFPVAYFGKRAVPEILSALEFELEQALTANIHITPTIDEPEITLRIE